MNIYCCLASKKIDRSHCERCNYRIEDGCNYRNAAERHDEEMNRLELALEQKEIEIRKRISEKIRRAKRGEVLKRTEIVKPSARVRRTTPSVSPIPQKTNRMLVRSNFQKCKFSGHKSEDVNIAVPIIFPSGDMITRNVSGARCPICDVCFIRGDDFETLRQQGVIACRVVEYEDYYEDRINYDGYLQRESLLHQYGYNVNQTRGLTTLQRQIILANIISAKLITKHHVISHISWLIDTRKGLKNMELAVSKWQDDLQFVKDLQLSDLQCYYPQSIEYTVYHKK